MAMTYGFVYVASVSMGADQNQVLRAIKEAEAYKGPSLIIAYAPCINHGIRKGMNKSMEEGRLAVESGYWPLYRFHPDWAKEGRNPLQLDSKAPDGSLQEVLAGENRYAQLAQSLPEDSRRLREALEQECIDRFRLLRQQADQPPLK